MALKKPSFEGSHFYGIWMQAHVPQTEWDWDKPTDWEYPHQSYAWNGTRMAIRWDYRDSKRRPLVGYSSFQYFFASWGTIHKLHPHWGGHLKNCSVQRKKRVLISCMNCGQCPKSRHFCGCNLWMDGPLNRIFISDRKCTYIEHTSSSSSSNSPHPPPRTRKLVVILRGGGPIALK